MLLISVIIYIGKLQKIQAGGEWKEEINHPVDLTGTGSTGGW